MQESILLIDGQEALRDLLLQALRSPGRELRAMPPPEDLEAAVAETDPALLLMDLGEEAEPALELLRARFPELPVVLLSSDGDARRAVRCLRAGARDYFVKPLPLDELRATLDRLLKERRAGAELLERHRRFRTGEGLAFYKLQSPAMEEVYEQVAQVAMSRDTGVLISGESGTGKEIVARLIHDLSPRREDPFVVLNCASIPGELLENELFGHEPGAYTDARIQKPGLVEEVDRGTLFLDEIGEMPLSLQVKVLRFLENRSFRRVGGTRDLRVDVRIVSASNQDLQDLVAARRFRADLYYRLNVVPIRIRPLRERREDILPLLQFFAADYARRFNRPPLELDEESRRVLLEHPWPGNVRELKNLAERLLVLDSDGFGGARTLRSLLGRKLARGPESEGERLRRLLDEPLPPEGIDLEGLLAGVERRLIRKALRASGGNRSRSAELLGLGRDKLRYRLKSHALEKETV